MKLTIMFLLVLLATSSALAVEITSPTQYTGVPTVHSAHGLLKYASASKVIAIGERHQDLAGKRAIINFLTQIRRNDPSFDCLGLELDSRYQGTLDRGEFPSQLLIESIKVQEDYNVRNGLGAKVSQEMLDKYYEDIVSMDTPWFDAARAFKSSGASVYAIDYDPDPSPTIEGGYTSMKVRNESMADTVKNLLNSSRCKKMILINGNAHIRPNSKYPSLIDLLGPVGVLPVELDPEPFPERYAPSAVVLSPDVNP
jgi:hypothetical protein